MAKWIIDQSHSEIGFEVRHMMISKVRGTFDSYDAEVEADNLNDLTSAKIKFKIDAASINTRNEERDTHLRSADFFDVENNPTIDFIATTIRKLDNEYEVLGNLTINKVTKDAKFEVEFGGKAKNPWGVDVYAFEAKTKINREEFGLTWNAALETGGVLVGKDVKIKVELQLHPA